jgi:hypothetical protein
MELEELRRLCLLASFGSIGVKPELLAIILRISVRDTTPTNRPLRCAPGNALAVRVAGIVMECVGGEGRGDTTEGGGTAMVGAMVGVGGAVDAGLGVSTTHILQRISLARQR